MQSSAVLVVLALLSCALCATQTAAAPFKSAVQGPPGPPGPATGASRRGEASGDVQHNKGYGTSVHVRGSGDAWVSRDGNTRLNVGGHYGQVVGGPAKGNRDYGVNAQLEHRW